MRRFSVGDLSIAAENDPAAFFTVVRHDRVSGIPFAMGTFPVQHRKDRIQEDGQREDDHARYYIDKLCQNENVRDQPCTKEDESCPESKAKEGRECVVAGL